MAKIWQREWKTAKGEARSAWVADYFDQHKKRHIKTFPTMAAADAYLVEARHEVAQRTHTAPSGSPTVTEAGEAWIAKAERDGLERSTVRQYTQHLNHHLAPFIGTTKLADLSPGNVEALRNALHRAGRSAAMIRKIVGSLGGILADAMANGRIARNVVREVPRQRQARLAKRHKKRIEVGVDVPTKAEINAMIAAAQGRWRPFILTAVFTGMRASELRGLTWGNVDLDKAVATVRQRADCWNAMGSPKSAGSRREIPLAPIVVNALREWKLACPKGDLGLVFPNTRGKALSLVKIHYQCLAPLEKAAGIVADGAAPKYGMHSLRHFAASLFIEEGLSPKRVQSLLGHSTIGMTFDTYGHLFPSEADDRAAMQRLQARLVG